jgi:hypothetical protein
MINTDVELRVPSVSQSLIPLVGLTTLFATTLSVCVAYGIAIPGAIELLWTFEFGLMLTW